MLSFYYSRTNTENNPGSVASKIMAKMGYREGEGSVSFYFWGISTTEVIIFLFPFPFLLGLGKTIKGITTPLELKKTASGQGVIANATPIPILPSMRSSVVLLKVKIIYIKWNS